MSRQLASLSLDLDNKWSYLKTHGDARWESYPSYLDIVVPRVLNFLDERRLTITFFVVGQDAAIESNRKALQSIVRAGHEIGNHSFRHEPWLHLYSAAEIAQELADAESAIAEATGVRTKGFRGPGFSVSPQVISELVRRGYDYDASTFPTFLGPVARLYFFFTANLSREERARRKQLFGRISAGFQPLKPFVWPDLPRRLLEIPVTTMPIIRLPIHASYVIYLAHFSRTVARTYFRTALALCRWTGVEPSFLLHPLDFLGCDDDSDLSFCPGMNRPSAWKLSFVGELIDMLGASFEVTPMAEHCRRAGEQCRAARRPSASALPTPKQ